MAENLSQNVDDKNTVREGVQTAKATSTNQNHRIQQLKEKKINQLRWDNIFPLYTYDNIRTTQLSNFEIAALFYYPYRWRKIAAISSKIFLPEFFFCLSSTRGVEIDFPLFKILQFAGYEHINFRKFMKKEDKYLTQVWWKGTCRFFIDELWKFGPFGNLRFFFKYQHV